MAPVTPSWFKQRQGKTEEVAPNVIRISGPNMKEAFLGIRQDNGRWHAFVRHQAEGADVAATTNGVATSYEAWEVAFEMYRNVDVI